MIILARRRTEELQDMLADVGQVGGVVSSDIEHRRCRLLLREYVEPPGEQHHPARAARGFEQALGICVQARRPLGARPHLRTILVLVPVS